MFPIYFSIVPLFPKTPGRLSVKKGFSSISPELSQTFRTPLPPFSPGFLPSCPLALQKFCVWLIIAFCFASFIQESVDIFYKVEDFWKKHAIEDEEGETNKSWQKY